MSPAFRIAGASAVMVLLACVDAPTDAEPGIASDPVVVPSIRQSTSMPAPPLELSAGKSVRFSQTVAITDAVDRLVPAIKDGAVRSALQGYLRALEAHWLGGERRLAEEALTSSLQMLSRMAAIQRSAELDAIELALQDAAKTLSTR